MRFSSIKTDKDGKVHLYQFAAEQFMTRIQTDANNFLVTSLRDEVTPERVTHFRRYSEVPHICAPVELRRQDNGALGVAEFNGIVVLEVRQLMSRKACDDVKRAAMEMPMTLAAFIGATDTEVIMLVRVERADGTQPANEMEAETFYTQAYHRVARIYDAALPVGVTRITPSLRHTFLMPLDESPLANWQATACRIQGSPVAEEPDDADNHLLTLPEQRSFEEMDMTAYENYERAYSVAARKVAEHLGNPKQRGSTWYKDFVTGMAIQLYAQGWPEEETVCHLWRHFTFRDDPSLTEDFVRTLVNAVYEEETTLRGRQPSSTVKEPLMQQIIRRMESRYVFRRNTVMGYAEYRANHTWITPWRPVTKEVVNTFTTDLQLAGLENVWARDVRRYVESTRIRSFNPVEEYLFNQACNWDGRDHIRALAATVPTDNPSQWADWFHTWFLAMVAQWTGRDRRYGNAIVPLLISNQGMHKSAFCRSLLPPELRSWGYTDNLSLGEERPVHLAMSQMLLINLDEFNRISPQKQQGFLKNILQLPSVKVKRLYANHTEEVPRLASFIATTNMSDVLTDPTGSRRFLGVQVTGSIDVSQTPNYAQLYAQAQAELQDGQRYWFDDAETRDIMEHNRRFQLQSPAEMFFHQYFDTPASEDQPGQWMSTTDILLAIRQQAGAAFKVPAVNSFGRTLRGIPDLIYRRARTGSEFYVRRKL